MYLFFFCFDQNDLMNYKIYLEMNDFFRIIFNVKLFELLIL